jgi:hypothetical protein
MWKDAHSILLSWCGGGAGFKTAGKGTSRFCQMSVTSRLRLCQLWVHFYSQLCRNRTSFKGSLGHFWESAHSAGGQPYLHKLSKTSGPHRSALEPRRERKDSPEVSSKAQLPRPCVLWIFLAVAEVQLLISPSEKWPSLSPGKGEVGKVICLMFCNKKQKEFP